MPVVFGDSWGSSSTAPIMTLDVEVDRKFPRTPL